MGLKEIEDIDFKYTHTSLNKVYSLSYNQALENIKANEKNSIKTFTRLLFKNVVNSFFIKYYLKNILGKSTSADFLLNPNFKVAFKNPIP